MRVEVLLFGPLAEAAGRDRLELELPAGCDVGGVVTALRERAPEIGAGLDHAAVAVNETYATADHALREGDRIALIPPVSGG